MKWYHSLIIKVTLIFALALLGIGAVFFSFAEHEKSKDVRQMLDYSHMAMRSAFDNTHKTLDMAKLEELGFVLITDESL